MSQFQRELISQVLFPSYRTFKDRWAGMVISPLHALPKRPWDSRRGTCMPGQVGEEGICTLPHGGWEVCHQTAVRSVPRNPFWSIWSPEEFFSSCNAVWAALLVLPSCMHRQGCCLAGDSHAWTKGTRRRRVALCHTGTPEKRETALERARWG